MRRLFFNAVRTFSARLCAINKYHRVSTHRCIKEARARVCVDDDSKDDHELADPTESASAIKRRDRPTNLLEIAEH